MVARQCALFVSGPLCGPALPAWNHLVERQPDQALPAGRSCFRHWNCGAGKWSHPVVATSRPPFQPVRGCRIIRHSFSWGAMTLSPYITSLVRGNPAAGFAVQMPSLVRLHVFSAFAVLAVLPLTRAAAFMVFTLHRSFVLIGRPISAVVRAGEAWLRKHNPAP